jgi:predicted nucleotidyltransferase
VGDDRVRLRAPRDIGQDRAMEAESWDLTAMATRLAEVEGVEAVLLGGSRARGDHLPGSDYDLGLYYRQPLDVAALGRLAREVSGQAVEVTEPGGWGPWVDGGGWLTVDGVRVDWIYRNIDRVQQAWTDARAGRFAFHRQPGHQLGVPDFAYVGEVALGLVLVDATGEVTDLRAAAQDYPAALTASLVAGL